MRLASGDGTALELRIDGYEFPSAADECDSNWLLVSLDVTHPHLGKWSRRDPCLETTEAAELATWLREVASGIDKPEISFTEPNLSFELIGREGETVTLAVLLDQEFTLWPREDNRIEIGFLTAPELLAAAEYLEEMLARFPQR